jgi:hypothetical protein
MEQVKDGGAARDGVKNWPIPTEDAWRESSDSGRTDHASTEKQPDPKLPPLVDDSDEGNSDGANHPGLIPEELQEEMDLLAAIESSIDAQEARERGEASTTQRGTTKERFKVRMLPLEQLKPNSQIQYCCVLSTTGGDSGDFPPDTNVNDSSSTWDDVARATKKRPIPHTTQETIRSQVPGDDLSHNNWHEVEAVANRLALQSLDLRTKYKFVPDFVTPDILQEKYLKPFRQIMKRDKIILPLMEHFEAKMEREDNKTRLLATGPAVVLDKFRVFFRDQFHQWFLHQSMLGLMQDKNRFEFEMILPCGVLLSEWNPDGALVEYSLPSVPPCLFIDLRKLFQDKGEKSLFAVLTNVLGRCAMDSPGLCLAISHVDFTNPCPGRKWQPQRETLNQVAPDDDVVVTLVVGSFTRLEDLVKTQLLGELRRPENPDYCDSSTHEDAKPSKKKTGRQSRNNEQSNDKATRPTREEAGRHDVAEAGTRAEARPENGSRPPLDISGGSRTIITTSDISSEVEGGSTVNRSAVALARKTAYLNFQEKFRAVNLIEFQRTEVNCKYVTSQMWKMHKELVGDMTCDEDCPCPYRLEDLTGRIASQFVLKQKLGSDRDAKALYKSIEDGRAGFVDKFGTIHHALFYSFQSSLGLSTQMFPSLYQQRPNFCRICARDFQQKIHSRFSTG